MVVKKLHFVRFRIISAILYTKSEK